MIYLTTKSRWNDIKTLRKLSPTLKSRIRIVVQNYEYKFYLKRFPKHQFIVLPKRIKTLEPTREFLWRYSKAMGIGKFFLLDDDMAFYKRVTFKQPLRCKVMEPEETVKMFDYMYDLLDKYAHVGISEKLGNNRVETEIKECTRYVRLLGYNLNKIPFEKLKFGRLICMSDYDMNLQLLKLGLKSGVTFKYAQDHGASNSEGGCSVYRSLEVLEDSALKMVDFHPGIVTAVKKKTKGAWFNGKERTDVRIQWQKAYQLSKKKIL